MDNKPYGPCILTLTPVAGGKGHYAVGSVDADGEVEFTTFKKGDGVVEGEYKVTVRSHVSGAPPKPVPADYQSEAKTDLRMTVATSGVNEMAFDLLAGKGGKALGDTMTDAFRDPAFSAGAGGVNE